jgi:hypothetical protein
MLRLTPIITVSAKTRMGKIPSSGAAVPTAREWVRVTRGSWDKLRRSGLVAEFLSLAAGAEGLDDTRRT